MLVQVKDTHSLIVHCFSAESREERLVYRFISVSVGPSVPGSFAFALCVLLHFVLIR